MSGQWEGSLRDNQTRTVHKRTYSPEQKGKTWAAQTRGEKFKGGASLDKTIVSAIPRSLMGKTKTKIENTDSAERAK